MSYDPYLMRFISSLRGPRPNLDPAISIIRRTDGLRVSEEQAKDAIYDAMFLAAMSGEAERQKAIARHLAREINRKRAMQLQKLKSFREELVAERVRHPLPFHGHGDIRGPLEKRKDFVRALTDLDAAIVSLDALVQNQRKELSDRGGNNDEFERAFVYFIKITWHGLTGEDAGKVRSPVIEFAAAIWTAFGLPEKSSRPLFDWFRDRFRSAF